MNGVLSSFSKLWMARALLALGEGWRRSFCFLLGLVLLASGGALAQELDAVVTNQNQKSPTIADEITNPAEQKAYLELFKKRDPAKTAKLAEAFLAQYPQSWELAQIYGIAARAYINLGAYPQALSNAKQSLRLYPEDPLLLVPVANVQAQTGDWRNAIASAHEALDDLSRFVRPSSVPQHQWPVLKEKLEASCYFAIGRAETVEALNSSSPSARSSLLEKAVNHLTRARALDSTGTESVYLQALAELGLNRIQAAAVGFAAVAEGDGPLKAEALKHLLQLYAATTPPPAQDFQAYLRQIVSAAGAAASAQGISPTAPPSAALPEYAGSQSCRFCHSDIYTAWHTGMSKMFQPYKPQNLIGDFTVHNSFYAGDDATFQDGEFHTTPGKNRWLFARMVVIHGHPYFETRNQDGRWHQYPVDYTIGSKWEQAYATRLPDGEIQVFPIQYNRLLGRWVDFWKFIDPPDSPRADLHRWGEMGIWTNYQANCAVCHTSQLRSPGGGGFAPKGETFREPGVDCEMCHGPCARHVAAMMKGQPYSKQPLDPPIDFTRISAQDFMAICAQCHMQSAVRAPGPRGELNYSTRGEFFVRYRSRPYDEFSHLGFYKDGRFRQTTFIVESLMRSECFRKGHITCGNCHDVHAPNPASNLTLLKFPEESNRMCTQCHTVFRDKAALVRHTRHPARSPGSRCVACHMPRIMNALLFMARTHRIDDIPNADSTLRFGQQDSPNACLLCHKDKVAQWVKEKLVAWKETPVAKP